MHHPLVPRLILEQTAADRLTGRFPAVGLFVDISGFSAMGDALMLRGEAGAEALAAVIRSAFAPLLASVAEQGGFVAKQAGDAFTALFPIEAGEADAARRALAAAWAMQQRLAAHGPHETPFGTVQVTAKAGLALGEASWGVVTSAGDGRRAVYYFQGSAVVEAAAAEHQAGPGEVLVDAGLHARLAGLVRAEPAGEFFRVSAVTGELPAARPGPPAGPDLAVAERFFPRDLLIQRQSGEFRYVTNVFVNLPTVRSEIQLRLFMQTVFELLDRYGGLLSGLDFGDKGSNLLLFWGAYLAQENDVERALSFLLDLQAQTSMPINGGVTHRLGLVGFIGGAESEEFTGYGRGISLAARLMAAAPRGEIWLDEPAARQAEARFEVEPLGAQRFKGFAEPQAVFALVGRKDQAAPIYAGPLVGREAELQRLQAYVSPMLAGRYAGLLLVRGEAGVGKSRLVHAFVQQLVAAHPPAAQVLVAQTDAIVRESLNPVRYALWHYVGLVDGAPEARNKRSFNRKIDDLIASTADAGLAERLDRTRSFLGALLGLRWPDSLYELLDAQGRYENTLVGLAALLQAESRRRPVVLVLEDSHWLDGDTRRFLPRLLQLLASQGDSIAILATARPADGEALLGTSPDATLDLHGLVPASLRALAEARLAGPVGEDVLDLLAERSEGNPFFAEQVLRYLEDEGLLRPTPGGWRLAQPGGWSLPPTVQAVLVARLDRLAQEVKDVVQAAAVLGREFELRLLAQMLRGDPALPDKVATAERQAIWVALSELRFLFRHTLLRDAAYEMQVRARRQALHALAVEALQTLHAADLERHWGELAYHAEHAGQPEQAIAWYEQAGRAAAERFGNAEAVAAFSRALNLLGEADPARRLALLLAREKVSGVLGARDAQAQDLAVLAALAQELGPDSQAEVELRRARYAFAIGNYAQALDAGEAALKLARQAGTPQVEAAARVLQASTLVRQGDLDAAGERAGQALALARAHHLGAVEADALRQRGLIAYYQGKPAAAREFFTQAHEQFARLGDRQGAALATLNIGGAIASLGDFRAAGEYYERSLQMAREIGDFVGQARALNNLGIVALELSEFDQAESHYRQATKLSEQTGSRSGQAAGLNNLGNVAHLRYDFSRALAYQAASLELGRAIGDRIHILYALENRGRAYLALGQLEQALGDWQAGLEQARAIGDRSVECDLLGFLSEGYCAAGKLGEASAYAREALAVAQALDAPPAQVAALLRLGRASAAGGQQTEALRVLSQALAISQSQGERNEVIPILVDLAEITLDQGEMDQALARVEAVLQHLASGEAGAVEGLPRLYLVCYRVLSRAGDARAEAVLAEGHRRLEEWAALIAEPALRQSFLENVPANRQLREAWLARPVGR